MAHAWKNDMCKILAKFGVLLRFRRGGKNSNFGKKGAIFKVNVCNENKNIFKLARSEIEVLGLQKIILKLILYWNEDFRSRFGSRICIF